MTIPARTIQKIKIHIFKAASGRLISPLISRTVSHNRQTKQSFRRWLQSASSLTTLLNVECQRSWQFVPERLLQRCLKRSSQFPWNASGRGGERPPGMFYSIFRLLLSSTSKVLSWNIRYHCSASPVQDGRVRWPMATGLTLPEPLFRHTVPR